jgi:hypothetical protein
MFPRPTHHACTAYCTQCILLVQNQPSAHYASAYAGSHSLTACIAVFILPCWGCIAVRRPQHRRTCTAKLSDQSGCSAAPDVRPHSCLQFMTACCCMCTVLFGGVCVSAAASRAERGSLWRSQWWHPSSCVRLTQGNLLGVQLQMRGFIWLLAGRMCYAAWIALHGGSSRHICVDVLSKCRCTARLRYVQS